MYDFGRILSGNWLCTSICVVRSVNRMDAMVTLNCTVLGIGAGLGTFVWYIYILEGVMFDLPTCRYCGEKWAPKEDIVASQHFCENCRSERKEKAQYQHDLKPLSELSQIGDYIFPKQRFS